MEETQKIEFSKIRSLTEIFSDYWKFLQAEWKTYCTMLGVFVLPFALLGAYFMTKQAAQFESVDLTTPESLESISLSCQYLALTFSFIGKFLGTFISCAYIILYMQNEPINFDSLLDFTKKNFVAGLLASAGGLLVLFVGFLCLLLPGILLLPAISMLIFDVLVAKQPFLSGLTRCIQLSRTDFPLSLGVVYLAYAGILVITFAIGSILPDGNSMLGIIVSSLLTVLTETVMIPFILLYYSLANKNLNL